ncbi:MAG: hypothetical protein J5934_01695 [Succinivibrio sp.]|nr:hypothetical protein [Succinivibrio sp.]
MKKVILVSLFAVLLSTSAQALDESHPKLTFSKSQGPYSELFITGVQPLLEAQGYTVNAVDMSDLLQADLALNEEEVDFNVEQHTAYLENFNSTQNGDLVPLVPIPTVPAGIYPGAKTALSDVKEGDTIAVPNDASNTARAYNILQKIGWIKLDPAVDPSKVTKDNIVGNDLKLNFVEMKSLTIPAVATDFAFVVITGSVVYNAKVDPASVLAQEDIAPHLLLQLVVKEKNKDAVWAQDIKKAYTSPEFKKYIEETNTGLWFVPEYK